MKLAPSTSKYYILLQEFHSQLPVTNFLHSNTFLFVAILLLCLVTLLHRKEGTLGTEFLHYNSNPSITVITLTHRYTVRNHFLPLHHITHLPRNLLTVLMIAVSFGFPRSKLLHEFTLIPFVKVTILCLHWS